MRTAKTILASALLAALALPGAAQADTCAVDDKPATSLLIPYFEVDLSATASTTPTTRIWVRNTATRPKLAQVNLWSDWGIAVFAFYVYLPAKATQRIDLADVLIDGKLPSTGAGVSPIGDFDSVGTALPYPNCNNTADPANGLPVTPNLSPSALNNLRARLSGQVSPGDGLCWAFNHGDGMARGYVTIDNVLECSNALPTDPGYPVFALNLENVLEGGFEFRDPLNNFAQGGRAVAIESNSTFEFVPGDATFLGRYHASVANDQLEPLPPSWRVEFDNSASPDSPGAELIVWRGAPPTNPRPCGQFPFWFPLGETGRRPYDTDGDTPAPPVVFPGDPPPFPELFGLATGRYPVERLSDTLQGTVTKGSGELLLLNFSSQYPMTIEGQAWVGVVQDREGRFSEIRPGVPLDTFCEFALPQAADVSGPLADNPNTLTYLFSDDFED